MSFIDDSNYFLTMGFADFGQSILNNNFKIKFRAKSRSSTAFDQDVFTTKPIDSTLYDDMRPATSAGNTLGKVILLLILIAALAGLGFIILWFRPIR